ncbi:MAG: hypothetical protein U0559_14135 [Anaerolineae bacterium]
MPDAHAASIPGMTLTIRVVQHTRKLYHEVIHGRPTSTSGGVDFKGEKIDVGNDVVGRDKIVQNITQQTTPTEPIHNSLPNQPYFFGRAAELARIADALDPDATGWGVLIAAPAGLARRHWQHAPPILRRRRCSPLRFSCPPR